MTITERDILGSEETLAVMLREGFRKTKDLSSIGKSWVFVFPEEIREVIRSRGEIKTPATIAYIEGVMNPRMLDTRAEINLTGKYNLWAIRRDGIPIFMGGTDYSEITTPKKLHVVPKYCLSSSPRTDLLPVREVPKKYK